MDSPYTTDADNTHDMPIVIAVANAITSFASRTSTLENKIDMIKALRNSVPGSLSLKEAKLAVEISLATRATCVWLEALYPILTVGFDDKVYLHLGNATVAIGCTSDPISALKINMREHANQLFSAAISDADIACATKR